METKYLSHSEKMKSMSLKTGGNKKNAENSAIYGKYYPHTINGKDKYYWFTKAPAYTNIVRW